jgi:hypothetical protein
MSALRQLELIKKLQTEWSDNSVSCTVYYRPEELDGIIEYLKSNYTNNHKSLSFLLHSEHGFVQAPMEEITEATYEALLAKVRLITSIDDADFDSQDECASGACPVR